MSIKNAIIPGNIDINVSGVSALCASLNVFDVLAIAIDKPLIKSEYVIITIIANIVASKDKFIFIPSYILNILLDIFKDIIARIKLNKPVITEESDTLKNLPIIISTLNWKS